MRKIRRNRSGFTLLELIVVIIVGVLTSLALPRFIKLVERSRSVEAFTELKVFRDSVERAYLMGGTAGFNNVMSGPINAQFGARLGMDDPATIPNSHFDYSLAMVSVSAQSACYGLRAQRNSLDLSMAEPGGTITTQMTCGGGSGGSSSDCNNSQIILVSDDTGIKFYSCGFYQGM